MLTHERTFTPASLLPAPAPLPDLGTAFSRRSALFGVVMSTAALPAGGVPKFGDTSPGLLSSEGTPTGTVDRRLGALSADDAQLVAMAAELRVNLAKARALAESDPRDCDQIPGLPALQARQSEISDALFQVGPDGLAGLVAAADMVLQLAQEPDGDEDRPGRACNLAADVLRILGGGSDG